MRRCQELFLAGCTSAEPVCAWFRQNKYSEVNFKKDVINTAEKLNMDKWLTKLVNQKLKRKKGPKKERRNGMGYRPLIL